MIHVTKKTHSRVPRTSNPLSVTKEASDLFHRFNPAGTNQIGKAYFQKAWLAKGAASDKRLNMRMTKTEAIKKSLEIYTEADLATLETHDESGNCQKAEYDALCALSPRERIVKVWSTPTVSQQEAKAFFCQMAGAGNNQTAKAHFQKTLFEEALEADKEHTDLPSLMRPRINIQGTVTGRSKAAPNLKEEE